MGLFVMVSSCACLHHSFKAHIAQLHSKSDVDTYDVMITTQFFNLQYNTQSEVLFCIFLCIGSQYNTTPMEYGTPNERLFITCCIS